MPILREKLTWIPLYGVLAYCLFQRFNHSVWKPLLAIVALVVLTDGVSSKVLKPYIHRPRPCHSQAQIPSPTAAVVLPPLVACGSGYSMPSSHATNHFGIAVLVGLLLYPMYRRALWWLLLWAASIAAAQVYCGVHYPTDVLAGALLGTILAGVVWWASTHTYLPREG
jgi:membrane-associated phospholipid phosphatase